MSEIRCQRLARVAALLSAVLCMYCTAFAVTLDQVETWDGTDTAGWVAYDLVNQMVMGGTVFDVDAGSARLEFAAQGISMPPEHYYIMADGSASSGAYAGDYLGNGVMAIAFKIFCDTELDVWARFRNNQTGRLWRYRIPGLQVGVWQDVMVPVDLDTLQYSEGGEGWEAFKTDLQNVSSVGIAVLRNSSTNAQVCRIDDFVVTGAGSAYAAWVAQFGGVGDGNTLPGSDLDGDGADNYGEWIAGTSAGDEQETFEVMLEEDTGPISGGRAVVLKWDSVFGRKYTVLRTLNPSDPFGVIASDIDATPPQNVFEDVTATNPVAYYYRLRVGK